MEEICMSFNRLALFFIALLVFTGCNKTSNEIRIGTLYTLTGNKSYSDPGQSAQRGVELAVEEINAAGGILGKKVVISSRDDQWNKEKVAVGYKELVEKEKVVAVISHSGTDMSEVSAPIANERKIPTMYTLAVGLKPSDYTFLFVANTAVQAPLMVREAITVRSQSSVATLTVNSGNGKSAQKIFLRDLEAAKIKPVYVGEFNLKDKDMTKQLTEARKAGAQALLIHGMTPEAIAVTHSLAAMNWKVDVIGSSTLSGMEYGRETGKESDGITMVTPFIDGEDSNPVAKAFIEKYHAKFNENPMSYAFYSAQGYDAVYLLKMALEQAGTTEGPKLLAALEDLQRPYDGVIGKFIQPFSAKDHAGIREQHLKITTMKNGRPVLITK